MHLVKQRCWTPSISAWSRLSCHLAAAVLDAFRAPAAPEPPEALSPGNRRRSGAARPSAGHPPPVAEPQAPPADPRRHQAALEWICGPSGGAVLQVLALRLLERLLAVEPEALPALRQIGAQT